MLFTKKIVKEVFVIGKNKKYIKSGCYVAKLWDLWNAFGKGNYRSFRKVMNPKIQCPKGSYEILCYVWPQPIGKDDLMHFVVGDGKENIIYDSMGDASPVIRKGKLSSKRFIRF